MAKLKREVLSFLDWLRVYSYSILLTGTTFLAKKSTMRLVRDVFIPRIREKPSSQISSSQAYASLNLLIKDLSLLSGTIFHLLRKQCDKKRRPKSFFLFTDIVRQLENSVNTNIITLQFFAVKHIANYPASRGPSIFLDKSGRFQGFEPQQPKTNSAMGQTKGRLELVAFGLQCY